MTNCTCYLSGGSDLRSNCLQHGTPPPPTGEPTILACPWPRQDHRRTYKQALRMVWNSVAIAGLIALAAALTQLGPGW